MMQNPRRSFGFYFQRTQLVYREKHRNFLSWSHLYSATNQHYFAKVAEWLMLVNLRCAFLNGKLDLSQAEAVATVR
jgi:hypothetical protein